MMKKTIKDLRFVLLNNLCENLYILYIKMEKNKAPWIDSSFNSVFVLCSSPRTAFPTFPKLTK